MKKGQILLITVMLLATAMTIVLSVSFKSVTETQVTKLEEESQKALAAAEAAIEVSLKNNATAILGPGGSLELANITGFTGEAVIDTATSTKFTSPLLQKDKQYTFYLSTSSLTAPFYNGDLTLCFDDIALELTIVKENHSLQRYAINPSGSPIITNGATANGFGSCPSGENFPNKHQLTISGNNLLLIVRVISPSFSTSRIGFTGSSNLPLQGRTITSQATSSTSTGVSKKVVLFQSYPQIPGEFFTTTF